MSNRFVYTDEDDKCYGLTGMVISLNVLESDSMLQQITLDADTGESITFPPDFFFCSNPRYSAKITWNEMLKQYQLMMGMTVGNVLCRSYGYRHKPLSREGMQELHDLVAEDGRDVCSLEDDEIDTLFNKIYNYLNDVYGNYRVCSIADSFVGTLKQRRTMSGGEIIDELNNLRRR